MAVVILTFTASEEEISSGIPKQLTIDSNIPSTIHYTLDGNTPTLDSPIYVEPINFPTGVNSITISAFGIDSENNQGYTLTQFFAPDTTRITIARNIGIEGIVIDRANYGQDISTAYDIDGAPARFVDIDPEQLHILTSRGFKGIEAGTVVVINVPLPIDTPSLLDDNFQEFSTPERAELFNPYAKLILIDNRKQNDIQLMLRPYGSLNNIYREFGGKRLRSTTDDAAYVSGGFVRRFYDQRNGVMVSYYYDHNESRYIKNIQQLPNSVPQIAFGGVSTMPLVFQWLERGSKVTSL